jgi:hypothetical protein
LGFSSAFSIEQCGPCVEQTASFVRPIQLVKIRQEGCDAKVYKNVALCITMAFLALRWTYQHSICMDLHDKYFPFEGQQLIVHRELSFLANLS